MTSKHLGVVAAALAVDAVLVFIVGAAMWSDAPSRAHEAVGQGLVVVGIALAIPPLFLLSALLDDSTGGGRAPEAATGE